MKRDQCLQKISFIPWIENLSLFPLKTAVLTAIRNNVAAYMDPPMKYLSYKGIDKASDTIVDWFDNSKNRKEDFGTTAMLMERAGIREQY